MVRDHLLIDSRLGVIPHQLLKAVADTITPIVTIVTVPQKEREKGKPKRANPQTKAKAKTNNLPAAIMAPATAVSYKLLRSG